MNENAYMAGFFSKCAEAGVDADFAAAMLKMAEKPDKDELRKRRKRAKLLMGVAGGALMGGSLANMGNSLSQMSGRKVALKEALLRVLAGAAGGAATGGVMAHLDSKYKDYLGLDPLSNGVVTVDKG